MKKGWQTKRLGEVCEIIKGRKPMLKATPSNGDLPYLVAKVMRGSAEAEYASVKDRNSVTVETTETIIICDGSNSGEVFTGFRGVLSSTMGKIAKKAEIDDDYLRAFLASTFEVFNGAKTGAAIPHLDKEAMYQLQFPFPPLAEQQRIVGLLDEAFEVLATAKANAEKNLQNARALFESHLQSVFTQRGPGWVEKRLGELCERITKGSSPKWQGISYVDAPGILFVTSENVGEYDILLEQPKYVEEKFNAKDKKSILKNSDVLTNIVGASIGRTAVFDRDDVANINQAVCLIRCEPHLLNNYYLAYLLNSPVFKQVLHDNEVNNARANLSLGFFSQLPVPMPPIPKQKEIVAKLDAFREETQRLARLYERKHAALEALKKSLLHQAFNGEL